MLLPIVTCVLRTRPGFTTNALWMRVQGCRPNGVSAVARARVESQVWAAEEASLKADEIDVGALEDRRLATFGQNR
jgi:hypothetical protein